MPDALWDAAVARARKEGTTPNEVLITLALEGARHHRRALDLRARVLEAETAIYSRRRASAGAEAFETGDEAMRAALAYRDLEP